MHYISMIVIVYNMGREAPRTLQSFLPEYQNMSPDQYEVIVIDNGSNEPLGEELVKSFGSNFHYHYIENASPSPCQAINIGAEFAQGSVLGIMIDGARIASPGLLRYAKSALKAYDKPVIATLPFHLGPVLQAQAIEDGYNKEIEDQQLTQIDWFHNGYRLFEISAFGGSALHGWFMNMNESSCLFVTRDMFIDLEGFDERFDMPGGGLANIDFYRRACALEDAEPVTLLGEGTFHQLHDASSSAARSHSERKTIIEEFKNQYKSIRGYPFDKLEFPFDVIGHIPQTIHPLLKQSIDELIGETSLPIQSLHMRGKNTIEKNKPPLIILGMHRSGTSVLTGSLQEAGLSLGDVSHQNVYNRKGNQENSALAHMHENILEMNGGSWHNPPTLVTWHPQHKSMRDLFIRSFQNEDFWGFKDPRTLITLDEWLTILPEAQFVGIFRHPALVALSLQKRNKFPPSYGLEIWRKYNSKLLSYQRRYQFPIIEFELDPALFQEKLYKLCEMLGLETVAEFSFFEQELRTSTIPEQIEVPSYLMNMYHELQALKI